MCKNGALALVNILNLRELASLYFVFEANATSIFANAFTESLQSDLKTFSSQKTNKFASFNMNIFVVTFSKAGRTICFLVYGSLVPMYRLAVCCVYRFFSSILPFPFHDDLYTVYIHKAKQINRRNNEKSIHKYKRNER